MLKWSLEEWDGMKLKERRVVLSCLSVWLRLLVSTSQVVNVSVCLFKTDDTQLNFTRLCLISSFIIIHFFQVACRLKSICLLIAVERNSYYILFSLLSHDSRKIVTLIKEYSRTKHLYWVFRTLNSWNSKT